MKVLVPSQVMGFGLLTMTGPVGVNALPQASNTTGGTGCTIREGQATCEAVFAGTVKSGYAGNVNVAVQLLDNGVQLLVYVNVTVLTTATGLQISGAPMLLFVRTPLQPPEAVADANHVA